MWTGRLRYAVGTDSKPVYCFWLCCIYPSRFSTILEERINYESTVAQFAPLVLIMVVFYSWSCVRSKEIQSASGNACHSESRRQSGLGGRFQGWVTSRQTVLPWISDRVQKSRGQWTRNAIAAKVDWLCRQARIWKADKALCFEFQPESLTMFRRAGRHIQDTAFPVCLAESFASYK